MGERGQKILLHRRRRARAGAREKQGRRPGPRYQGAPIVSKIEVGNANHISSCRSSIIRMAATNAGAFDNLANNRNLDSVANNGTDNTSDNAPGVTSTRLDEDGVKFFRDTFGRGRVHLDTRSDPPGVTVHYLELIGSVMWEVVG
jgi:hypothetical protein